MVSKKSLKYIVNAKMPVYTVRVILGRSIKSKEFRRFSEAKTFAKNQTNTLKKPSFISKDVSVGFYDFR